MTKENGITGSAGRLEAIRTKIADLDRCLVEILADRVRFAEEAARVKSDLGLPLRDPEVEEEVVRRLENICETCSLEHGLGRELARIVIRLSIDAQAGRVPPERAASITNEESDKC